MVYAVRIMKNVYHLPFAYLPFNYCGNPLDVIAGNRLEEGCHST